MGTSGRAFLRCLRRGFRHVISPTRDSSECGDEGGDLTRLLEHRNPPLTSIASESRFVLFCVHVYALRSSPAPFQRFPERAATKKLVTSPLFRETAGIAPKSPKENQDLQEDEESLVLSKNEGNGIRTHALSDHGITCVVMLYQDNLNVAP